MQPQSIPYEIQNMPNTSMMGLTYNPTFGNISFAIQPSMSGEVNNSFGIINGVSLEGLLYQQQMQAQVTPVNILPGQNTGQQNTQGTITTTDGTGNVRVAISGGGTTGGSTSSSTGTF